VGRSGAGTPKRAPEAPEGPAPGPGPGMRSWRAVPVVAGRRARAAEPAPPVAGATGRVPAR